MNKKRIVLCVCLSVFLLGLLLFSYNYIVKNPDNDVKIEEKRLEETIDLKKYEEKTYTDEDYKTYIKYPYFSYLELDKQIVDFINENKIGSIIDYDIFYKENILNIFFKIQKNGLTSYKNINYDINKLKTLDNQYIYDYISMNGFLLNKFKNKYSNSIYQTIKNTDIKNASFKVDEKGIYVYFNQELFNAIIYPIFVFIPNNEEVEVSVENYDKVVAFTFDDGPSEYTLDIVNALVENNSKATFFELGNKMKYNRDIVKEVFDKGMEIASHTYSHKSLDKLSKSELTSEINSTNIIFKEITGSDIKLTRPPYGNLNSLVKSTIPTPIITWNIDTNDWLYRNSDKVYNHILENAEDGDIILMHDIYPETVDALKRVLPELISRGFKVTSVSELSDIKGVILESHKVYRSIK